VSGAEATIEDLGSKNGTYVGDGTPAITGPTALRDDSRFRLGGVVLVFRSSPEAGSTLTEHRG
jgi:pSer/pThr/pTyr-binding forkhead associated (FHA) protein